MNSDSARSLCTALLNADSEVEVVAILESAGYWNDATAWRYIGDIDNNFSTIGNQQSEPVAALVEKIVNGIDARLVSSCRHAGLAPESSEAPTSIREAVARFYEKKSRFNADVDGRISQWSDPSITAEGRLLTLAATGAKPGDGRPCLSIADAGEGQTPDAFPDTFLSLARSNKLRIHFVQGKFNMGGTGALNFCSENHRLQLVISRRDPALLGSSPSERDKEWGFTIVRRQRGDNNARSTVFTYLAPVGCNEAPRQGGVLSFGADEFPIFPDDPTTVNQGADAYARNSSHGSLVKLYEYEWPGSTSNIVSSGDGLLRRVDLALPELALPLRLYECRQYNGGRASFSTNALGLTARLDRDRAAAMEPEFPIGTTMSVDGRAIKVRVYAFKQEKAKQYRPQKYGVLFSINGQMHASMTADFFARRRVGLSYLSDSLLVIVDCSGIDELMREDLFMNSRDRLRDKPLGARLIASLEDYLKTDAALRELQNRRREERMAERLADDQPLADVLQGILKANPLLSKLFQHGLRLSAPFPTAGTGRGSAGTFDGREFPTYFRFKGKSTSELHRECHIGSAIRIGFETDAVDNYFSRDASPGSWRVRYRSADGMLRDLQDWIPSGPRSGVVQLSLGGLPPETVVGDVLEVVIEVADDSSIEPFVNTVFLRVLKEAPATGGGQGGSRNRNAGNGDGGSASQLALPNIIEVRAPEWERHGFDDGTALRVIDSGVEGEGEPGLYDFYINLDNRYLLAAQKEDRSDAVLLQKQFLYGMVLTGLALIQGEGQGAQNPLPPDELERRVEVTTRSLAPVFLPMLEALGGLNTEEG